ncbi:MAG: hypothetical protein ACR2NO_08080 [Chloroflexota bacterium]
MTREAWSGNSMNEPVQRVVASLLRLASSDDACRILGVDGTLEDEIDLLFLSEPLEWIAGEIANALRGAEDAAQDEADDEAESDDEAAAGTVSLSTMVALVRLYKVAAGRALEVGELAEAVVEYLNDEAND